MINAAAESRAGTLGVREWSDADLKLPQKVAIGLTFVLVVSVLMIGLKCHECRAIRCKADEKETKKEA